MKAVGGLGHVENWGIAWLLLCLSFAANILDDVLNDFLGYYNAIVLTLYGHFSWFPRVDLSFREWLVGVVVADAVLLLLSPWAFRNALLVRPIAYDFATIMLLNGCGSILAALRGPTLGSVHFTGMAPGTYSSPLLLAGSADLLRRLRTTP
jgi:hypothetical protein